MNLLSWIIAIVCILLFIFFPIISLHWVRKTKSSVSEGNQITSYAELKASLLFLQTALPTILFLLAALGYTTYHNIVKSVTERVTSDVHNYIEKKTIDSLRIEISDFHVQAQRDAESIQALAAASADTIGNVALQSILKFLPKGTILPYTGSESDIDKRHWAICDGTKGTPDLRSRFIMGSSFKNLGDRGGSSSHTHSASTIPRGNIRKVESLLFPHKEGPTENRAFEVERHNHAFNGITTPVTVDSKNHLPPYYQLVFLMKIK